MPTVLWQAPATARISKRAKNAADKHNRTEKRTQCKLRPFGISRWIFPSFADKSKKPLISEVRRLIFQFGEYKIDVDVEKTKQFYNRAKTVSEECQCDGCLNFEKAVDELSQNIRDFFSALGVDMKKICECYVYCAKDENTLYYGGFCHICGTLLSGKSAWKPTSDSTACWDEKATYPLSPNFVISFSDRIDMLEPDFPLPVVQLDFDADIPWVLEKKNSYIDE